MGETLVATVRLEGWLGQPQIAGPAVEQGALVVGLSVERSRELRGAVEAICETVEQQCFDEPDQRAMEVSVFERDCTVVVRLDDMGLPFNPEVGVFDDGGAVTHALG